VFTGKRREKKTGRANYRNHPLQIRALLPEQQLKTLAPFLQAIVGEVKIG